MVAISIPIFTSQLEKAREATDLANIRSAYAEATTEMLTDNTTTETAKVGKAQSTGKLDKTDTSGIDWYPDIANLSLTKADTYYVHVTVGSEGTTQTVIIDTTSGE